MVEVLVVLVMVLGDALPSHLVHQMFLPVE
jgi:hypothetical protein